MKTTIKLTGVNEKTSKNNRQYRQYETGDGFMSCFETDVCTELNKHIGRFVEVEVEERNGFKNITKYHGVASDEFLKSLKPEIKTSDTFAEARASKDQSMYTSYAKDVFIELMDKIAPHMEKADQPIATEVLMNEAIKLVKQAKEAFK